MVGSGDIPVYIFGIVSISSWFVMVKCYCDVSESKQLISYNLCCALLPNYTCQKKVIFTSASMIHLYELQIVLMTCGGKEKTKRKCNTDTERIPQ